MGMNIISSRFMLYALKNGVDFLRTATMGRQGMHLRAVDLLQNFDDLEFSVSVQDGARLVTETGYAEPFFHWLGADEVLSFDASKYEGADHACDFNQPLDEKFVGRFSVVVDAGTLEHIFNFPQAIANCMRMVETGGHFLGVMPVNNLPGHGFYQFSPELLFRVFCPDNGFCVRKMFIAQQGDDAPYPCVSWKETPDPAIVGHRMEFRSQLQACLLVMAQKISTVPLFSRPTQQSDYVQAWK